MGLNDVIRNALVTANSLTASLQATVSHYAWTGQDGYGKPTFATAVSLQGVVEFKQRMRRLPNGEEVTQVATVTFVSPVAANGASGRREPIDPRDKIVLPNGFTGPILDVSGVVDPSTNAPYMLVVVLGTDVGISRVG